VEEEMDKDVGLMQAETALRAAAQRCRDAAALLRKISTAGSWSDRAGQLDRHVAALDKAADELRRERSPEKR
jgi:hypothetical protein